MVNSTLPFWLRLIMPLSSRSKGWDKGLYGVKISTFPGADWSLSQEIGFPTATLPLLCPRELLAAAVGHHHGSKYKSCTGEASQVTLLRVLVGRVQWFGHLTSFPPNYYDLEVMFMGIPHDWYWMQVAAWMQPLLTREKQGDAQSSKKKENIFNGIRLQK